MLENLRGMAVFATVVKHGSFSLAAKELNITTSAVSQQIRSLEDDLGVTLLQRSTRKLSLTEAGEMLYQSAINMVQAVEQGRHKINEIKEEISGNLRISITPQLASTHLLTALADWMAQNTSLSIHFILRGDDFDFINDRADIRIGLEKSANGKVLAQIPQVMLASKAYLSSKPEIKTIQDLSQHDFILFGNEDEINLKITDANDSHNVNYIMKSPRFSSNSSRIALKLTSLGYGILYINALDAKTILEKGELTEVLKDATLPNLYLTLNTSKKDFEPNKVTQCIKIIEKYFAEHELISE